MKFLAEADGLGQQVEKCDANDCAGTESQDQMQFIMQLERQQAAEKRAEKRRAGDDYE